MLKVQNFHPSFSGKMKFHFGLFRTEDVPIFPVPTHSYNMVFLDSGAITLIQLQEDMKRQLNEQGDFTEEQLEEYMLSHKKMMIDSLWKLNVADIEATLSRVCQMVLQDSNLKREELRARAKGLKTLGKIFQRAKSSSGNDSETGPDGGAIHKLNGCETSHDRSQEQTNSANETAYTTLGVQSPYVEAPNFFGAANDYSFPMPTAPPGAQRHFSTGKE